MKSFSEFGCCPFNGKECGEHCALFDYELNKQCNIISLTIALQSLAISMDEDFKVSIGRVADHIDGLTTEFYKYRMEKKP